MGNIGSVVTMVLIVVLFLAGLNVISSDISTNTNLDSKSITLLSDINDDYDNNYRVNSTFESVESNITENSTYAGVDAFARQYLEDKSEINSKTSTTEKILGFPGLFLKMFGVENETLLIAWNTAIYSFIAFMLSLYLYKAIRTGEVD